MAYRSFSPSKFEARGARKVTTGMDGLHHPIRVYRKPISVVLIRGGASPNSRPRHIPSDMPSPVGPVLHWDRRRATHLVAGNSR